jgi:2-oxoglutarate ferredoxin oxidoreductase subunit alpha
VPAGALPYDWDAVTGIARRFVPGQPGGVHTVTGLAHDRASKVAYDPNINEEGLKHRSLKLAALQKTLKAPEVFGAPRGDLLIVGWGSTKGTIEEAVERARAEGLAVSSLHIKYIQPMASGIRDILKGFKRVMTIESAFCDNPEDALIDADSRRYAPLATILRSRFPIDIDCWGQARGQPIKPGTILQVIRRQLAVKVGEE